MISTVVVVNQRGGAGKTTTALALSHYLSALPRRVLLIDLDVQESLTVLLGLKKQERTVFDMLESGVSWRDCVVETSEFLHVIPADKRLARIENFLNSRTDKEVILRQALEGLTGYDAVVIDCGPSLSLLHSNAFSAASDVLLTVAMDKLSLTGVNATLVHLDDFHTFQGYGPTVAGVLPTLVDKRTSFDVEMLELVKKAFGRMHVYDHIRIDTRIKRATERGGNIFEHKMDKGIRDYAEFCQQFLRSRWPHLSRDEPANVHGHVHSDDPGTSNAY